jgi:hypothetical protein
VSHPNLVELKSFFYADGDKARLSLSLSLSLLSSLPSLAFLQLTLSF